MRLDFYLPRPFRARPSSRVHALIAVVLAVNAITAPPAKATLRNSAGVTTAVTGPTGTGKLRQGQLFFDPNYGIAGATVEVQYSADLDPDPPSPAPIAQTIIPAPDYDVDPSNTMITGSTDPGQDPNFPRGSYTLEVTVNYNVDGFPPPGPTNLFSIVFDLVGNPPPNTPERVNFGFLGNPNDFILTSYQDDSGNYNYQGVSPGDPNIPVQNSSITFAAGSLVPEPMGLALGGFAFVILAGPRRGSGRRGH